MQEPSLTADAVRVGVGVFAITELEKAGAEGEPSVRFV